MGQVDGLTAARMQAIEAACIVAGAVDLLGHLQLTRKDGSTFDAGAVYGPMAGPGTVVMYASANAPGGWILCDGAAYDGANPIYAALYNIIGTSYGTPVGTNFTKPFSVPNMVDRTVIGKSSTKPLASQGGTTDGDHQHTTPNHQHGLSGAAWAQITSDITDKQLHLNIKTSGVSAYTTVRTITGSAEVADSITGTTAGVPLDGLTDSGGTGTTTATKGDAGVANPGLPGYTAMNYLIKL
jgi:microcystin-dependent protein